MNGEYERHKTLWDYVSDCYEGSERVKYGPNALDYLPMSSLERDELYLRGAPFEESRYSFRRRIASYENFFRPVVDDVVGLDTKSVLMAWLYKAYNPHTRKGGRMADYKHQATLIEYTQDYEPIRSWQVEGMFLTKLDEQEFDRENDGKRQISATFVFDRAIVDLPSSEEE